MTTNSSSTERSRGGARRWIALLALAAGLIGAWLQAGAGHETLNAALLMTHVEVPLGGVALTRAELRQLSIETREGHWLTLPFGTTGAPEAVPAQPLEVAADAKQLRVKCTFALPTGGQFRSRGQAKLPTKRDAKVVVIDVGSCAETAPER